MSVLLLNASYEPLTIVSWKRAMTLLIAGRAELVEQDGDRVIRSAGGREFPFPNVVRLMRMISFAGMRSTGTPRFSKSGLNARDNRDCQIYGCGDRGSTVDHVVPRSRGGDTSWENCVLMCQGHNSTKGDRSLDQLGWALKKAPVAPVGSVVMLTARPEWDAWITPVTA
jgi:5-methylcytosine-specific restriction endonuclease McrA